MEQKHKSGFIAVVGRPNVGKSTLINSLIGQKIAIMSDKPQTTRRAIRGILNRPEGQLVLVDTPGLHRPRTLLGQRLNDLVEQVLGDVDVIGFCVPATEKIGPGDRRIAVIFVGAVVFSFIVLRGVGQLVQWLARRSPRARSVALRLAVT